MAKKLLLQHPESKKIKTGFVGFSWVTFFFEWLVPLVRGDWKMFLPLFVISGLIALPITNIQFFSISQGIQNSFSAVSVASQLWAMLFNVWSAFLSLGGGFFYNKIYTGGLIKKGWRPLTEADEALLRQYKIKVPADYELRTVSKVDD